MMFLFQTLLFLFSVALGIKYKGLVSGAVSVLFLSFFVFVLKVKPEPLPLDVPIVILSVVVAVGCLEVSGGLNSIIRFSEKIIRRYPSKITIISPIIVYIITFCSGTGHTIYSILPVISTVAKQVKIRPEKPLSVSVIAAQQAALASPISVISVVIFSVLSPLGVSVKDFFPIYLCATFFSVLISSLVVYYLLSDKYDSVEAAEGTYSVLKTFEKEHLKVNSKSALLFLLGLIVLMCLGINSNFRPSWSSLDGSIVNLDMTFMLVMIMFSVSALSFVFFKISPSLVVKSATFTTGIQAAISILGVAWFGTTFIKANQSQILSIMEFIVSQNRYLFALILFVLCIPLYSQSTTLRLIIPLGIAIGLDKKLLISMIPAVNSVFFIPNYPTILAAINLDVTGSTKIGKFFLNHSFMLPGLTATISALIISTIMASIYI